MKTSYGITLIGSGNVAHHLCEAFARAGISIDRIYCRNAERGKELSLHSKALYAGHPLEEQIEGDIVFFAVSDQALPEILKKQSWNEKILIHTAGSVPATVFAPYTPHYGVLYPLQTLSVQREVDYGSIPFFIEFSDETTEKIIKKLASSLSCEVRVADSGKRRILHLSAVLVSNFVTHLCTIAAELGKEQHIPFEVYHPLLRETIAKIIAMGPFESQTGPARRGDTDTIKMHEELLAAYPDWQKIYTFTSQSILNMYHSLNDEKL